MMTAKQELIQLIERSPNELVYTLLEILKVLQRQSGQLTQAEPVRHDPGDDYVVSKAFW
jgi:rRNA maturation protein Nop10